MLVIRKEQMEAMDLAMMKRFIEKSVEFLRTNFPDWSRDQADDSLTEFITSMTTFARSHHIRKEINIQKLMEYKITFDFITPLSSDLAEILKRDGFGEDSRLELFVRQLEDTSPLIELTLDDTTDSAP